MNRAQRRGGLNLGWRPRGSRLLAAAVSTAVTLATGILMAAPAQAADPAPDAEYAVGDAPRGIAVDASGTIAVTVNNDDNTASVIDLGTGVVSTVPLDQQQNWQPRDVAVDPSGRYAYVTNFTSGSVSRIDLLDLQQVTPIVVGNNPSRIVIDPAGVYAYVTVGAVADRIRLSDLDVVPGFLDPVTGPLIFTSDGATIYSYYTTATRFDAASGNDLATFPTGAGNVTGAGFNSDQTAIYGVNDGGWVRRTELATSVTEIWDGNGLTGNNSSSWVSVGNYAYVPAIDDGTLKRVDLRVPNTVTTFASNLIGPSDVAVPATNKAFILVASAGGDKVFRYTLPSPPSPPGAGSRALVWGFGGDSALGTGSTRNELVPVPMAAGANAINTWGTSWYSMDSGYDHTCGVGTDQRAYCWGRNHSGQLGDGTTVDKSVPVAVEPGANTGNTWVSVSAGSDYSSCGIDTQAKAYCWGENVDGRLGDGTTNDANEPVAVDVLSGPTSWSSVRVGNTHACGVSTDQHAYCWGNNSSGALGDGTTVNSLVPIPVLGNPEGWAEVSAGFDHTCGISTDNTAYCWGNNNEGELGDGSTNGTSVPVEVLPGENPSGTWNSIVTGYDATCAVGGDDKAYCWGWDRSGQLGNGVDGDQLEPMRVALPMGVSVRMLAMDAYAEHVCAVSTVNVVYCWGYNGQGQLGNDTTSGSDVPVEVDLNAFPAANLAAGSPRMVTVGSGISLMVSSFGTAPAFTAASPPSTGTVGTAYSTYSFTASGTSPIAFTRASGTLPPGLTLSSNGMLSGTPTTAGTYTFTVSASNGIIPNAETASITIEVAGTPSPPNPNVPVMASAPREVRAAAAVESADVSWLPPTSPGTFPISSYEAEASPGGQSCRVTVPSLTCTIPGLTPGTAYTVTVRAQTAAGWSEASAPSEAVVPFASEVATIRITSSRDRAKGPLARVWGVTTGLVGVEVTPYIKTAGQRSFSPVTSTRTVRADGRFVWKHKAKKRFTVYFVSGDVTSNRLVIRPR